MNKKVLIIAAAVVIVAALVVICVIVINNNRTYKITYNDETVPGITYIFIIDNEYNVKVERKGNCDTIDCDENGSNVETYQINLSSENKEKLKVFVENLFDGNENEIEISSVSVKGKDTWVINALKYNIESFFDAYKI